MINWEQHLYMKLMEEAAEVQQRAAKALLFGADESEPGQAETNIKRLQREIDDLLSVAAMLGLARRPRDDIYRAKVSKIAHYYLYAEGRGMVEPMPLGVSPDYPLGGGPHIHMLPPKLPLDDETPASPSGPAS